MFAINSVNNQKNEKNTSETNKSQKPQAKTQNAPQDPIPDTNLLLPDLQGERLKEAYIEGTGSDKKLRFATTVANIGDGSLEMHGAYDESSNTTKATQRIFKKDGTYEDRVVGNFIFHENHDHWHFEEFTEFQLYTYKDGGILDKMLTTTGKMTFCVYDSERLSTPLPNTPDQAYYPNCDPIIQGISVGWSDTYVAATPGPELDVSNVADGRYAVNAIADPAERIVEKKEDNNTTVSYIEIEGSNVYILTAP